MGTQYILQPNGKWACYSTTIDRLEAIDLREEDVIAIELEQAKSDTVERVQKYLADKKLGKRNQFSVGWEEALTSTLKRPLKNDPEDEEFMQQIKEELCKAKGEKS